ncbi:MAG TPA: bifunctional demethylmenaquinone methyltransferase/2-methoxy-6-polyprenyl-1,4-benzoquinol methylase UbiE [Pyrinomonadaceae bacterium]|nr:bifunctional demethylmenaquinone methyltransferase/2-methoxy-6-polyprenyl-1,4-benzoquinol methylase UbiE [Pyrinomonadaceae bacterium]
MPTTLTQNEKAQRAAVRDMFAGIARRYDFLNHTLSMNIDKRWRAKVSKELANVLSDPDSIVLDIACGTGDLTNELASHSSGKVIGTDFCRPMLDIAVDKNNKLPYIEADAMSLPFPDDHFDAVTIAFGLRNLPNFRNGLIEMNRILKPAGRLVVLEFTEPVIPGFGRLFNFYFSHILPRIGGMVSGSRGAYEYLPDSVSKFPAQKELAALFAEVGYSDVKFTNLTGGIAAIHVGSKA